MKKKSKAKKTTKKAKRTSHTKCYHPDRWHNFVKPTKDDCSVAGFTLADSQLMSKKERAASKKVKQAAKTLEECHLVKVKKYAKPVVLDVPVSKLEKSKKGTKKAKSQKQGKNIFKRMFGI